MRKALLLMPISLILVLAIIGLSQKERLTRLGKVIHLFDAEQIVHNFSHMDEVLPAHNLPRSGPVHVWPENPLPLPEDVQFSGKEMGQKTALADFLTETSTTALLVARGGDIVHESYYQGTGPDDLRISWSVAKSFLSALVGLAVESGQITSLDDQVTQYVPELIGSAYDGASLRNVLNMASGVRFDEDYKDFNSDINKMGRVLAMGGSMDDFAASLKTRDRPPGTGHQYVSIDTHVIGMVLRAATGLSVSDYFTENLWSKIGPEADAYYLTDGYDVAFVLGGLNMRTRDYARFGQLMMRGGKLDGMQIIPESWVEASTKPSAPPDLDGIGMGYGYQWWVPPGSQGGHQGEYFAVGIYGQYIYIDPVNDTVIVKNSAHIDFETISPRGHGYMYEEIELFRALTAHYAEN